MNINQNTLAGKLKWKAKGPVLHTYRFVTSLEQHAHVYEYACMNGAEPLAQFGRFVSIANGGRIANSNQSRVKVIVVDEFELRRSTLSDADQFLLGDNAFMTKQIVPKGGAVPPADLDGLLYDYTLEHVDEFHDELNVKRYVDGELPLRCKSAPQQLKDILGADAEECRVAIAVGGSLPAPPTDFFNFTVAVESLNDDFNLHTYVRYEIPDVPTRITAVSEQRQSLLGLDSLEYKKILVRGAPLPTAGLGQTIFSAELSYVNDSHDEYTWIQYRTGFAPVRISEADERLQDILGQSAIERKQILLTGASPLLPGNPGYVRFTETRTYVNPTHEDFTYIEYDPAEVPTRISDADDSLQNVLGLSALEYKLVLLTGATPPTAGAGRFIFKSDIVHLNETHEEVTWIEYETASVPTRISDADERLQTALGQSAQEHKKILRTGDSLPGVGVGQTRFQDELSYINENHNEYTWIEYTTDSVPTRVEEAPEQLKALIGDGATVRKTIGLHSMSAEVISGSTTWALEINHVNELHSERVQTFYPTASVPTNVDSAPLQLQDVLGLDSQRLTKVVLTGTSHLTVTAGFVTFTQERKALTDTHDELTWVEYVAASVPTRESDADDSMQNILGLSARENKLVVLTGATLPTAPAGRFIFKRDLVYLNETHEEVTWTEYTTASVPTRTSDASENIQEVLGLSAKEHKEILRTGDTLPNAGASNTIYEATLSYVNESHDEYVWIEYTTNSVPTRCGTVEGKSPYLCGTGASECKKIVLTDVAYPPLATDHEYWERQRNYLNETHQELVWTNYDATITKVIFGVEIDQDTNLTVHTATEVILPGGVPVNCAGTTSTTPGTEIMYKLVDCYKALKITRTLCGYSTYSNEYNENINYTFPGLKTGLTAVSFFVESQKKTLFSITADIRETYSRVVSSKNTETLTTTSQGSPPLWQPIPKSAIYQGFMYSFAIRSVLMDAFQVTATAHNDDEVWGSGTQENTATFAKSNIDVTAYTAAIGLYKVVGFTSQKWKFGLYRNVKVEVKIE